MLHYESLRDRLIGVDFKRCSKQELFKFIEYHNEVFREKLPDKFVPKKQIIKLLKGIPNKFNVTMRTLNHAFAKSNYDICKAVRTLCN